MKTAWFTNKMGEKDKSTLRISFQAAEILRRRLSEVCKSKATSSIDTTTSSYESPNWALRQADAVGYQRAMKEVISLIES